MFYVLSALVVYMPIHYGLGYLSMGLNPALVWILLTVDSFVVGLLALNLAGAGYFAVNRRRSRNKWSCCQTRRANPVHGDRR
ncbi:MAG: hypothetical protein U5O39_10660 [Gammaproteobacteria bacterium]|nr:hypothetical protein [Gammaproteobacteria bacterium]